MAQRNRADNDWFQFHQDDTIANDILKHSTRYPRPRYTTLNSTAPKHVHSNVCDAHPPPLFGRGPANTILARYGRCGTEQHSQIVRMLNGVSFSKNGVGGEGGDGEVDLCPASLEKEIDAMNEFVYEKAR